MLVVDFETDPIVGNPAVHPPRPVGVALKRPGYKSRYLGWGHPSKNNSSFGAAKAILAKAIADGERLLFHNAKFDISVLEAHFKLKVDPTKIEDTMFLVFLENPYADSFGLKESAYRILGVPNTEQENLKNWVLSHVKCPPSEWGAYISKAPCDIVAPYACGDVDRTYRLHRELHADMPSEPYQRELRLLPILLEGERLGVRCDLERLEEDVEKYETALLDVDRRIRKAIKSPECNLDSGRELADAIERAGLVKQWVLTPTGQRSTARKNLQAAIDSPRLVALLQYRGALAHCLSNFGRPWLAMARTHQGRLYPEWNQVRQSRGQGRQDQMKGTRTGRLSSTNPNFQNPPNEYEGIIVPPGLPDLPLMRSYLLPEKGHVWLKRDYSQQELRILAHFSEGRLYERYCEDPRIDAHEETADLIREYAHMDLPRKAVKIVGFSIIYGSGVPHLSEWLGVDPSEGRATRDAYFLALPEVQTLMRNCTARGRFGQPITTWGGRNYLAEPGKGGRDFAYKLLNYLIQGSAADCTKEAIIRWHHSKAKNLGVFIATVHDEINIGAPAGEWTKAMAELKVAMESIEFDVKMLSDGYKGESWGSLKKLKLAA